MTIDSGPILIDIPRGLEDLVPRYLASRLAEIPEMASLLAAADFKPLAVLAHNIKGTGCSYGFTELTCIGAKIEASAKQKDAGALAIQLDELTRYLGRVELRG